MIREYKPPKSRKFKLTACFITLGIYLCIFVALLVPTILHGPKNSLTIPFIVGISVAAIVSTICGFIFAHAYSKKRNISNYSFSENTKLDLTTSEDTYSHRDLKTEIIQTNTNSSSSTKPKPPQIDISIKGPTIRL